MIETSLRHSLGNSPPVCVRERERERGREGGREKEREGGKGGEREFGEGGGYSNAWNNVV